jgi:hypothetical protein
LKESWLRIKSPALKQHFLHKLTTIWPTFAVAGHFSALFEHGDLHQLSTGS